MYVVYFLFIGCSNPEFVTKKLWFPIVARLPGFTVPFRFMYRSISNDYMSISYFFTYVYINIKFRQQNISGIFPLWKQMKVLFMHFLIQRWDWNKRVSRLKNIFLKINNFYNFFNVDCNLKYYSVHSFRRYCWSVL